MRRKEFFGQVGTSITEAIASSTSYKTISAATACNTSSTDETLDVWILPTGTAAVDSNRLIKAMNVSATQEGDGLALLVGQTMDPGDILHVRASTASAINLRISADNHN